MSTWLVFTRRRLGLFSVDKNSQYLLIFCHHLMNIPFSAKSLTSWSQSMKLAPKSFLRGQQRYIIKQNVMVSVSCSYRSSFYECLGIIDPWYCNKNVCISCLKEKIGGHWWFRTPTTLFLGSVERVRGFCKLRRSNINADDYTYKCMLIYIDRSTTTIMENGRKYLATKSHILSLYIRDLTVRLT